MRTKALFLAAVVIAATFVPSASALPRDDLYIAYYNCELTLIGEYYRDCWGHTSAWGSQTGDFKYEETHPCGPIGDSSYTWFAYSNGSWQYVAYPAGCAVDETTTYYCWPVESGTHSVSCSGAITDTGTLSGTHKHVVKHRCSDNAVEVDQWYSYSNGSWVECNPPNPNLYYC